MSIFDIFRGSKKEVKNANTKLEYLRTLIRVTNGLLKKIDFEMITPLNRISETGEFEAEEIGGKYINQKLIEILNAYNTLIVSHLRIINTPKETKYNIPFDNFFNNKNIFTKIEKSYSELANFDKSKLNFTVYTKSEEIKREATILLQRTIKFKDLLKNSLKILKEAEKEYIEQIEKEELEKKHSTTKAA